MIDAAVSLSVVLSGILIHFFHWYALDGITAIIIAIVVLFSTWRLFKDSVIAILDGVPASVNSDEVKEHLKSVVGVKNIHNIHIWGISTNENALTAHIVVDNMDEMSLIKKVVKDELEELNINHSTLEFELTTENCKESDL